jgi:hypothetical protein
MLRINGELMLEVLHPAQILPVGIFDPFLSIKSNELPIISK